MAENKKDKKEKPPAKVDAFEEAVIALFILLIVGTLATKLLSSSFSGGLSGSILSSISAFFGKITPSLKVLSILLSGLFVAGIAHNLSKLTAINKALNAIYGAPVLTTPINDFSYIPKNRKWDRVMIHMASDNPSDWKLAILEADIMLEELLDASGYRGETMSDKLKKVEKSDFTTIEAAWEAHKTRNSIAHEGADFVLTRSEADRVVNLYKIVFEEFHFI